MVTMIVSLDQDFGRIFLLTLSAIGMDVDGGHASVEELRKAGNNKATVHIVPKAGHHVYLDNPESTNRIIDEAIKAMPRVGEAQ